MKLKCISLGIGLSAAVLVVCYLMLSTPRALANEQVEDFSAIYKINQDASVLVSEVWRYNFGLLKRNEIEFILPVRYLSGVNSYQVSFQNWSVIDEDGQNLDLAFNKQGNELQVIIKSKGQPFSGYKIFNVSYRVFNALYVRGTRAEFNWNVTGNRWNIGIINTTAKVELIEGFTADQITLGCMYGPEGALMKCFPKTTITTGATQLDFVSPKTLYPKEGLILSVEFPLGIIKPPSPFVNLKLWAKENWPLAMPFLSFLSSLLWWLRSGYDPRRSRGYGVRFSPPDDLSPLEMGYMYKNTLDPHDLAAEIFYLAVKGYLGIELTGSESGADYRLSRHRAVGPMSSEHQRLILDSLFDNRDSVLLSTYLGEMPLRISELEDSLKSQLRDKAVIKSGALAKKFVVTFIWLCFGILAWFLARNANFSSISALSFLSSGVLVAIVALLCPGGGRHWIEVMEHVKGFERYLSVHEDGSRLIHNAPVRNPELFESYLPYALVLGVERLWSAQFEELVMSTPTWFLNPYWKGQFNPHILSDDLSTLAMVVAGQIPIISV